MVSILTLVLLSSIPVESCNSSPTPLFPSCRSRPQSPPLVPRPNQIITQLLHSRRCLSWLYRLRVVCDEEGLLGLDDHGAFFALWKIHFTQPFMFITRPSSMVSRPRTHFSSRFWGFGLMMRTFFPYKLFSSAFMTKYFSPARWRPVAWTALGSLVSLKAVTTSRSS
jgi:hypothetical protein